MRIVCQRAAWATILVTALSLPLLLLIFACSSGAKPSSQAVSATPSIATVAATPTPFGGVPAPAQSPQAAPPTTAPPQATAQPSAIGTAPVPVFTATPLPPIEPAPCREGQIKGNTSTHEYYLPGMSGYSPLKTNVECFNTMDAAKAAGYHLPGQG